MSDYFFKRCIVIPTWVLNSHAFPSQKVIMGDRHAVQATIN